MSLIIDRQRSVAGDSPRALEFPTILYYVLFAAASAAICTQINVRLGVTPNTAVIGVLVAVLFGRTLVPLFRSPERQVLVETATSAGGFAGANIALVSFIALFLLGLQPLFIPLLAGLAAGMAIDIWLAARLFSTAAFPAEAAWPDGEAVGRVILAADASGRDARRVLEGVVAGVIARLLALPAAGVGIAFIGNPVALTALGAGLIVRAYAPRFGWDTAHSHIGHGMIIGAGLVQVAQTVRLFRQRLGDRPAAQNRPPTTRTHNVAEMIRHGHTAAFTGHAAAFVGGALLVAWLGRFWQTMPLPQLILWLAFAGTAALIHTIIVGSSAMLSGWFPSFAVAIALILLAALLRFPTAALALLAGYILSTGPQFADLGYDLKSGWIVRGRGADRAREQAGRAQQVVLQQVGGLVGLAVVALAVPIYWRAGLIPPMSRVVAATVGLAAGSALPHEIAAGALLGAIAQAAGGSQRSIGILFATGLLLENPIYGFALLLAIAVRAVTGTGWMGMRAPGLIAGDGLAGFAQALLEAL